MSFHGALGNVVAADAGLATVLIRAVAAFDAKLVILSSTSRAIETAAAACGLSVATTFLADRAYDDEGLLVSRKLPGSVFHDEARVLERVQKLLRAGEVETYGGGTLAMRAQSILLHGDTPGAVALAKAIRGAVEAGGNQIVPLSRQRLRAGAQDISPPYPTTDIPS